MEEFKKNISDVSENPILVRYQPTTNSFRAAPVLVRLAFPGQPKEREGSFPVKFEETSLRGVMTHHYCFPSIGNYQLFCVFRLAPSNQLVLSSMFGFLLPQRTVDDLQQPTHSAKL